MDKLTQLIDQMVQEKTFTMEGVTSINMLRERAKGLEEENLRLLETQEKYAETISLSSQEKAELRGQLKAWGERVKELTEREEKITHLEKVAAVETAKSETYKECVSLIFRNSIIRQDMYGQTPIKDQNGYTTQEQISETTTKTEE